MKKFQLFTLMSLIVGLGMITSCDLIIDDIVQACHC
jgi:hypothetical protein